MRWLDVIPVGDNSGRLMLLMPHRPHVDRAVFVCEIAPLGTSFVISYRAQDELGHLVASHGGAWNALVGLTGRGRRACRRPPRGRRGRHVETALASAHRRSPLQQPVAGPAAGVHHPSVAGWLRVSRSGPAAARAAIRAPSRQRCSAAAGKFCNSPGTEPRPPDQQRRRSSPKPPARCRPDRVWKPRRRQRTGCRHCRQRPFPAIHLGYTTINVAHRLQSAGIRRHNARPSDTSWPPRICPAV